MEFFTNHCRSLLLTVVVGVLLCSSCVDTYCYSCASNSSGSYSSSGTTDSRAERTRQQNIGEHNITSGTEGWTMRQCQEFCVNQYGQSAKHKPFPPDYRLKHHGNCGWCIVE